MELLREIKHTYPHITLVGEVKTLSPFGFKSVKSADTLLDEIAPLVDIVSIHTDPRWGGSWDWLSCARARTSKPILAKGFHSAKDEVHRALDLGANYVLSVGIWHGDARNWHECTTLEELSSTEAPCCVWNARNLNTGQLRLETFSQARKLTHAWLCQASYIKQLSDICPLANAILIGSVLA